jgi:phage terminase large subunit-like protein
MNNKQLYKTFLQLKRDIRRFFIYYKPSEKQLSFHTAGSEAIERLFLAGNRTGKTFCGCIEDAIHLTGNYPSWWKGHQFDHPIVCWVASESAKDLRGVFQPLLFGGIVNDSYNSGLIADNLIVKKAMGNNGAVDYAVIKHSSGGNSYVYFKSYEQGREKFQGARCHFIHLDEEPPYDIYLECLMRLSDVDGKGQGKLILTMTPLKGYTEMTAYFMQRNIAVKQDSGQEVEEVLHIDSEFVNNGKYYIQASWDDNPHLSEETKQHLRSSLKPYEREAREKGIPSFGTGLVYQIPESEYLIEPFTIPIHWSKVCGMDIGFNPAPTAVVFLAHDRSSDTIYVYKEYSVTQQTPAQHASSLLMMGLDHISTLCDPSANQGSQFDGVKLIEHYRRTGLKLISGKYAKELAISEVINRIRTNRFKVFSTCRKYMDEKRKYSRDEKGKLIKRDDHLMNALEFVILDGLKYAVTKQEYEYNYNVRPARL